MFSFLNFFKKNLIQILKQNTPLVLAQFYQYAGANKAHWVSLAINKKSIADSFLTKELDLITKYDVFSLKLAETKEGILHQLWKNQESICKSNIDKNSSLIFEFNQLIDKLIEEEIRNFQSILNLPPEGVNSSSTQISQEDKALEWMRVSFQILEKAIIESLTNPEYLFQTLLFFGINPKTHNHEIRIVTFNLDILFEIQTNNSLRVRIYNDKDDELKSNKKAALEGDFNFRKREMLDEITKLISVLSTGLKW